MLGVRFQQALVFAAQLHERQVRKASAVPYIAHLLAVAALVLEHGGDEDEAIAALLHDAVEDQGGLETRAQIARQFGERVTKIVDGCTDAVVIPKPPWEPRKQAYLEHLRLAERSVLLVAAADKLHNARSIRADHAVLGPAVWQRFSAPRERTLWYLRSAAEIIGERLDSPLAALLVEEVARLEQCD
jgi:(p)ppGpp synthase/HD superfamily hydrolase